MLFRSLAPMIAFYQQLIEERMWYENVKRKKLNIISNLNEIGRLLIALRIASGLTQKDLAKCLGVTEAQVSRDERNEYHGISVERVQKIIDVFGAHFQAEVKIDPTLERKQILAAAYAG